MGEKNNSVLSAVAGQGKSGGFAAGFRKSGILFHITSLPSPYGIGRFGRNAAEFIDFLAESGVRAWQFLPLAPVSAAHGFSPYMSFSAMAFNPLFIDPDALVAEGLLEREDIVSAPAGSRYLVDYESVSDWNEKILRKAHDAFVRRGDDREYRDFLSRESDWLDDYALFVALRGKFAGQPWYKWPRPLAAREPEALDRAERDCLGEISFQRFVQFVLSRQWQVLRSYAAHQGVALIGDMPIYVALDSVDVWSHQELFCLKNDGRPTSVAGVPPDYFSDTGQLWGNPLYGWFNGGGELNPPLLDWWERRLAKMTREMDFCRIDHFRAFASYWQVPAEAESAVEGEWVRGPGAPFFLEMERRLGKMPLIAEDLGLITPEVHELLAQLGLPGMKVLQFAFDSGSDNAYLPHNYLDTNCVVYTGTHDNDTALGWFLSDRCGDWGRIFVRRYLNSDGSRIHEDLIRLAMSSIAALAVIPMQDLLGYGSDCRMNVPGTAHGNWRWRLVDGILDDALAQRIRDMVELYNR